MLFATTGLSIDAFSSSHAAHTSHHRKGIYMSQLASETASATAGREGKATSSDGKINLALSPPGSNGAGTNPEQLFAAGYSACFGSAIGAVAKQAKVALKPHRRHQGDGDGQLE
jgi:organic hydroperoxide reductase OsmC/OhrA